MCSVLHPGLCKHRDFMIYHDVIRMSGQLNVFITAHNVGTKSVGYSLFRFSHGEVRKYFFLSFLLLKPKRAVLAKCTPLPADPLELSIDAVDDSVSYVHSFGLLVSLLSQHGGKWDAELWVACRGFASTLRRSFFIVGTSSFRCSVAASTLRCSFFVVIGTGGDPHRRRCGSFM